MSISCGRCPGWTDALIYAQDVLDEKKSACVGCTHEAVLRVVAKQFQLRQSQWWVVDGRVVIPIWVVERLRSRFQTG